MMHHKNMYCISLTADVFHEPMSWLKEVAFSNRLHIRVTADVSHAEMSWEKFLHCVNMHDMF